MAVLGTPVCGFFPDLSFEKDSKLQDPRRPQRKCLNVDYYITIYKPFHKHFFLF
jgi:hypothetical protein